MSWPIQRVPPCVFNVNKAMLLSDEFNKCQMLNRSEDRSAKNFWWIKDFPLFISSLQIKEFSFKFSILQWRKRIRPFLFLTPLSHWPGKEFSLSFPHDKNSHKVYMWVIRIPVYWHKRQQEKQKQVLFSVNSILCLWNWSVIFFLIYIPLCSLPLFF